MRTTFSLMLIAIPIVLVAYPMLAYVKVGWCAKRNDILDSLTCEARLAYFTMFCRGSKRPADATAAGQAFEALYERWYGRRYFVIPCALLLLAAGAAVTAVVMTALRAVGYSSDHALLQLPDLPATAIAALAGAYLWVVDDFTGRARRLDFAPPDVIWGLLRVAIAVPMGYAFKSIAAPDVAPFIAFALGAFPLSSLVAMLRRIGEKKLGLAETGDAAADEIVKLQGMNRAIVERLRNEDITTITQMAYCDPVRLVMRSNLSFNFVADCMSQALAWIYFEDALNDLRPLGLRGAVETMEFVRALNSTGEADRAAREQAVAALPILARAAKQEPATFRLTIEQIAGDPFTEFLYLVWQTNGRAASETPVPRLELRKAA